VWSERTRYEAFCEPELVSLAENHPGLTVVIHPTAELGHLDIAKLGDATELAESSAFICGPLPMRREFLGQLRAVGVTRSEIYFEEFRLR
jgi:predicted ferric reductase